MKLLAAFFLLGLVFTSSCDYEQNRLSSSNDLAPPSETVVQDEAELTANSTLEEVRRKFRWGAKMDKMDFEEQVVFDDYYGSQIRMCHVKDKETGEKVMSAIVYDNRLRLVRLHMLHVGDITQNNRENKLQKAKGELKSQINDGWLTVSNNDYYRFDNNGDIWYQTIVMLQDTETGMQDYFILMSPARDYKHLQDFRGVFKKGATLSDKKSFTVISHR